MSANLPKDIEKLLHVFKQAITAEQVAQAMYKEARDLCKDEALKRVFDGFYQDEVGHERELIERYGQFRKDFCQGQA